ncbi:hypothetical protein ILUMI_03891 [Ignelater luminosus]|uniref:Pyrrolo-quinoline quinone repeat domain-containing protein n=1 Tax=Ignelater luminosus TaxID=2038154 RepID=A0A8K0DEX8_IGNLU|nr:hypothetical protein ILUMI_03891 [Ignelater luminosus]
MVAVGSFSHIFAIVNSINGNIISQIVLPDTVESAGLVSQFNTYLYVGCHDGNMYCLDYKTGSIIWKYSTDDIIKCTPCFCSNNQAIAFGSYDKYVHCVNAEDGNLRWKTLSCESITSNPICYKERVYVATTFGTCLCLNEEQGEILWKQKVNTPIFGSPCIFYNLDTAFIVWPAVNGTLHCFACEAGKKVWTFNASGKVFSSLLWYKHCIIFGCHDHKIYCLEINEVNCTLKYEVLLKSAINSKPHIMLYNDYVYIVVATNDGNIHIVDFYSGKRITNRKLPGQVFSSPVVKDNYIYIGCRDNNLYCINVINNEVNK